MLIITVESPRRSYLPLRSINWRLVAGFFVVNLICLFFYRQLDYAANGLHRPALLTFLEETAGNLAGAIVFPLAYLAAIRFPLPSPHWRKNLLAHLVALCGISVIHTTAIAAVRCLLLPLFGFSNDYGYLPLRYPMEFAHLFIYYWFGVSLVYFFHELRFAQQQALREAKLDASLSEARLQNLQLQLEPHFLFNALNSISAAIYEDPGVADAMIGRLGELLRRILTNNRAQEVTLDEEIEILELYAAMMKARWEDRFEMTIDVEENARKAMVPQLLLQPLVENAVRHGRDERFAVRIRIDVRCSHDKLELTLRDHGRGFDLSTTVRKGIGIRNTADRLQGLYGDLQSFTISNREDGGAEVKIKVPLQIDTATEIAVSQIAIR